MYSQKHSSEVTESYNASRETNIDWLKSNVLLNSNVASSSSMIGYDNSNVDLNIESIASNCQQEEGYFDDYDENKKCFCFESDDDSDERIKVKKIRKKIARSCLGNIVITILLIVYTLIGSIIFILIEGGMVDLSLYKYYKDECKNNYYNLTERNKFLSNFSLSIEESRMKTVENIWNLTVNLNILYRENWTRLAAKEVVKFQKQLVNLVLQQMVPSPAPASSLRSNRYEHTGSTQASGCVRKIQSETAEWNLAKSFFYSLTLLTTIGFGNVGPKTAFGKVVTIVYCVFGIPLMLIYLTSMGTMLSNCARGIFTRSLCCCLCSKCGYCCYDEQKMAAKEKRSKRKREMREQQNKQISRRPAPQKRNPHQYETFNLQSTVSKFDHTTNSPASLTSDKNTPFIDDNETNLKLNKDSNRQRKNFELISQGNCIAPISFCTVVMIVYISLGTIILYRLETNLNHNFNITYFDSLFFCIMSLTTVGFYGNENVPVQFMTNSAFQYNLNLSLPNPKFGTQNSKFYKSSHKLTFWFCSFYIFIGVALTAMCYTIFYEEIVIRFKNHKLKSKIKRLKDDMSLLGNSNKKNIDNSNTDNDTIKQGTSGQILNSNSVDNINVFNSKFSDESIGSIKNNSAIKNVGMLHEYNQSLLFKPSTSHSTATIS